MFYNTKIEPLFIGYTEKGGKSMFYSILIDLHQLIYLL